MHVLWVSYQMQQNGFLYACYASATLSWIWWREVLQINQMYIKITFTSEMLNISSSSIF